jgi:hypothetical protein
MLWMQPSVSPPGRPFARRSATKIKFTAFAPTLVAMLLPGLFVACAKATPDTASKRSLPTRYVEGSFVVTVESTTAGSDVAQLSNDVGQELGCATKEPQKIDWGGAGTGVLSEQLANTYNVRYENCDLSKTGTSAVLAKFAASESVLAVEAEAVATASPVVENDPRKGDQGHLQAIRRDKACELVRAGSHDKPVIVAVVDTGVDTDHPDLEGVFLRDANGEIVGANFVGSGASMPPDMNLEDGSGHGTHVTGLIAAAANNGRGVVGVAACAPVKIMPVRVLGNDGIGSSLEIERGVKWAADHGADVISMSLGYTSSFGSPNASFYRSLYANLAAQNIIVFAAAGNDGYTNGGTNDDGEYRFHFPSSYDHVIAVAATTNYGVLTSFSNRGERVDIAAPGSQLLSTVPDSYARMSGTSMATPVASGAYAMALASARGGMVDADRIDDQQALEILMQSTLASQPLSGGTVQSGGVIDSEKLVRLANERFPVQTDATDDEEPTPQPAQPTQPIVVQPQPSAQPQQPAQPAGMSLVGLQDGGRPAWPQMLKLAGAPQGTRAVYFYWGEGRYFSKIYVTAAAEGRALSDSGRWFFYGKRTLKAVAYSRSGRILATKAITLRGY